MKSLLRRQIRRHLGGTEGLSEEMLSFLDAVNQSYIHFEEDREMLDRAMAISSRELKEAFDQLKEDNKKQTKIVDRLRDAIGILSTLEENPNVNIEEMDASSLAANIREQAQRIREAEDELLLIKRFIDLTSDSIQVTDDEGNFVFVNEEACDRFNSDKEDLLGKNLRQVEPYFQDKEIWEAHMERLFKEQNFTHETTNTDRNGRTYPVEVAVELFEFKGQKFMAAFARDITERRNAEERRKKLIENLESINSELQQFAYIVSHDLKSPLRGITNLISFLEEDLELSKTVVPEESQEYMALIKSRVTRMENLINGLLEYSKVGRKEEDKTSVNTYELVKEIISDLPVDEKFTIQVNYDLPTVTTNKLMLGQIFQNLLSNAFKYHDKNSGIVEVGYSFVNGHHQFHVKDDGPGIEEEYQQKIFNIFQTLNSRDKVESTGIGLSIIKKTVSYWGGKVWVESTLGEGSCFFFSIPKKG